MAQQVVQRPSTTTTAEAGRGPSTAIPGAATGVPAPSNPPLAGLLAAVMQAEVVRDLIAGAGRPTNRIIAPAGARPFLASALAAGTGVGGAGVPVLLVTATGREAEVATAAIGDLLGQDNVSIFPSWETLPHERLSPRADTVGKRLTTLRRLAHPEEHPAGAPAVVVATIRSLIQPMAPDLGELAPVVLNIGDWADLGELVDRLVTLAYTRVDMVEKRGEIAVRGGILDIFPPTDSHPVRVEFFGDEVTDIRRFAVTDQRAMDSEPGHDGPLTMTAQACREILLTEDVRARAGQLSAAGTGDPTLAEMLGKLAAGVAVEGMEALIPVLVPGRLTLLPELLRSGTHVILADPERIRTRAEDLVRTGADFLAASWMAAATGGKAPIDLAESAYRTLGQVQDVIRDLELPLWRIAPFGVDTPDAPGQLPDTDLDSRAAIVAAPSYRGEIAVAIDDAAERAAGGGATVLVVPGAGTAARAAEAVLGGGTCGLRHRRHHGAPSATGHGDRRPGSSRGRLRHHGVQSGDHHRVGPDRHPGVPPPRRPPPRCRPVGATWSTRWHSSPATTSCTPSTASASTSTWSAGPPVEPCANTWSSSTRPASAATPATGCSCRRTRWICSPATSAARCPR